MIYHSMFIDLLDQHKYIMFSSVLSSKTQGFDDYGQYSLLLRLRNHPMILVGSAHTHHWVRTGPSHLKGKKISLSLRKSSYFALDDFHPDFYSYLCYQFFVIIQIEFDEGKPYFDFNI